jgi:hypothetical protein
MVEIPLRDDVMTSTSEKKTISLDYNYLTKPSHQSHKTKSSNKQASNKKMCKDDSKIAAFDAVAEKKSTSYLKATVGILAVTTVAFLISTIVLASSDNKSTSTSGNAAVAPTVPTATISEVNPCEGKKPAFENVQCVIDSIEQTGEQSGVNVTKGYQGERDTDAVPITEPYWQQGLCPVNVSFVAVRCCGLLLLLCSLPLYFFRPFVSHDDPPDQ